ncbi:hypothetical protein QJQ45_013991, partial [Haematococcus lacustris]
EEPHQADSGPAAGTSSIGGDGALGGGGGPPTSGLGHSPGELPELGRGEWGGGDLLLLRGERGSEGGALGGRCSSVLGVRGAGQGGPGVDGLGGECRGGGEGGFGSAQISALSGLLLRLLQLRPQIETVFRTMVQNLLKGTLQLGAVVKLKPRLPAAAWAGLDCRLRDWASRAHSVAEGVQLAAEPSGQPYTASSPSQGVAAMASEYALLTDVMAEETTLLRQEVEAQLAQLQR